MQPTSDPPRRTAFPTRWLIALVLAFALGVAVTPGAATAASTLLVKVTNWPSQSLPKRTPVNLRATAYIDYMRSNGVTQFYTVPAGKWLVIQSMSAEGQGQTPLQYVEVDGGGAHPEIHETLPVNVVNDGGVTYLSTNVSGERYIPGGTQLEFGIGRQIMVTTTWAVGLWLDGYLVDKP